jgi:uncharacterized protein YecT (DUF1311 family)
MAALIATMTSPLRAEQPDPFLYAMQVTPEDGHRDPAIQRRYTARLAACQKKSEITYRIAACFEAEFGRQDAALNRAWKTALRRVPPQMRSRLLLAQRKWIAARDPFCLADTKSFEGGTIVPIIYSDCRVEVTIRRTMWLETLR